MTPLRSRQRQRGVSRSDTPLSLESRITGTWIGYQMPLRMTPRDVAGILTSDAYCGYPSNNVHLLLDEHSTLTRIRTALSSVARAGGPNDSVVIFFSGHGARLGDPANPQSALLPVEFDTRAPGTTSLSEAEFSAALRRISAERLLVLIDACHSGGVGSFKGNEQGKPLAVGYSEKSLVRLAEGTVESCLRPAAQTKYPSYSAMLETACLRPNSLRRCAARDRQAGTV